MSVIFITGIDTGSGKTLVTGLIARYLRQNNIPVITQKIVQTGCENTSEDILTHRKIMGIDLTEMDKKGLTCPYIFKYPASPHLSARMEQKEIDPDVIAQATNELSQKYETVLLEGSGGIYVPLTPDITILDYIEEHKYPVIVVTYPRLGSINHTLLTLEALKNRDLDIIGITYNNFPEQEKEIAQDTREVIEKYISQYWFQATIIDIPVFGFKNIPDIDFSRLF
ncbi:MAG: ATP-dependent dethiobiotin synthetase BioD [Spirochaetes bacterium]|nr:ATP-dependent dethiobiotin synthetase BioD [Spirochaetota bacterium]